MVVIPFLRKPALEQSGAGLSITPNNQKPNQPIYIMAITLKTDYRKTLGLPGYSSHSFSASVEVEINNIDDASREIQELYETLQTNVDQQIKTTGYVPSDTYGMQAPANGTPTPGNVLPIAGQAPWLCSPKQEELIKRLIQENNLDKNDIEQLALQRFRKGVKQLNKLEASGVIDTIFQSLLKDRAPNKSYKNGGQR